MFFAIAKLLVNLERPGDVLLLLLLVGAGLSLSRRWRRTGIRITGGVALAFLVVTIFPVAVWVTAPLENRFPQRPLPVHVDGLIVLGGAVDPVTTQRRGMPALNSQAERMTEFVRLARLYPHARLVFSGGGGVFNPDPRIDEAAVAHQFFGEQGLDLGRFTFEARSRDTYENVLFTRNLVHPRRGEVWLLVQSAMDVPRAVGIFRRLDWPVIPLPVSYKADAPQVPDFAEHVVQLDTATHEWLGLLVYRLTGRTNALFPAPQQD